MRQFIILHHPFVSDLAGRLAGQTSEDPIEIRLRGESADLADLKGGQVGRDDQLFRALYLLFHPVFHWCSA